MKKINKFVVWLIICVSFLFILFMFGINDSMKGTNSLCVDGESCDDSCEYYGSYGECMGAGQGDCSEISDGCYKPSGESGCDDSCEYYFEPSGYSCQTYQNECGKTCYRNCLEGGGYEDGCMSEVEAYNAGVANCPSGYQIEVTSKDGCYNYDCKSIEYKDCEVGVLDKWTGVCKDTTIKYKQGSSATCSDFYDSSWTGTCKLTQGSYGTDEDGNYLSVFECECSKSASLLECKWGSYGECMGGAGYGRTCVFQNGCWIDVVGGGEGNGCDLGHYTFSEMTSLGEKNCKDGKFGYTAHADHCYTYNCSSSDNKCEYENQSDCEKGTGKSCVLQNGCYVIDLTEPSNPGSPNNPESPNDPGSPDLGDDDSPNYPNGDGNDENDSPSYPNVDKNDKDENDSLIDSGTGSAGLDNSDNVMDNPVTGEITIFIVWVIGFISFGYLIYYCLKAKELD